jgi:hypothetical protein
MGCPFLVLEASYRFSISFFKSAMKNFSGGRNHIIPKGATITILEVLISFDLTAHTDVLIFHPPAFPCFLVKRLFTKCY